MASEYDWLDVKHPTYEIHEKRWLMNEIRLRGGEDVLEELVPFSWEYEQVTDEAGDINSLELAVKRGKLTEHFERRQAQATYINFPDMFATAMTGFLMREAPNPESSLSFGHLGEIRREREGDPTEAELVYYNVDGVGNDGSQWDNFWAAAAKRAQATGHRWMFVEAPEKSPATAQDVLDGDRPYLVEYSPLAVTNWHYDKGRLSFAVIRFFRPSPRLEKGELVGLNPDKEHYLLLVRDGFTGFGDQFRRGGWWLFDPDKKLVQDSEGKDLEGTWEKTKGEIPLFPLFADRDRGTKKRPAFSRPMVTELGQLAVSYMNLSSVADFDVWDAGGSIQLLLGVSKESFNIATALLAGGNKMAAVPKDDETGTVPQVYDASLGAVSAVVFDTRLQTKREEARELAAMQAASGTPDASGASKQAGFADLKSPRLALMASELEQAQNTAIHFLELRFGHAEPKGSVQWPKEFNLIDVMGEVREIFDLERLSGLSSGTLDVEAMMLAIRERQLVSEDDTLKAIENELRGAVTNRDTRRQQESTLLQDFGTPEAVE